MNEILSFWAQWLRPSAGLPTVQWSLLLAVAAIAGYLCQRHTGLPKVVGYSLVGTAAGLAGFSGAVWPLQGIGLFLLELGISIVLFECGGRIPLRWFRHNPMVLVQSMAESALTYFAVYWVLVWLDMPALGMHPYDRFWVRDEITGEEYQWGQSNYVRITPARAVAHILNMPLVPQEQRAALLRRE